jgi:hypothetical protein
MVPRTGWRLTLTGPLPRSTTDPVTWSRARSYSFCFTSLFVSIRSHSRRALFHRWMDACTRCVAKFPCKRSIHLCRLIFWRVFSEFSFTSLISCTIWVLISDSKRRMRNSAMHALEPKRPSLLVSFDMRIVAENRESFHIKLIEFWPHKIIAPSNH